MLVTVIVPTYNGARYIAATVESVIAQTMTDWELIVVDDGSSDSTRDIINGYVAHNPRIQLVCQAIGNVAAARNAGFAATSRASAYVMFLDHDDVLVPDALDNLVTTLSRQEGCVAAHGLATFIDASGHPCRAGEAEAWTRGRQGVVGNRLCPWPIDAPTTLAVEAVANFIYTPGQVLVRRAACAAIGPLDPATAPADDYDLWLRLCALGPIAFLDRVVLGFRQHDTNQSRRAALMVRKERDVRRKFVRMSNVSAEQRRLVVVGWRLWYRQLAYRRLMWARECLADRSVVPAAHQTLHALESYMVGTYGVR